MTDEIKELGDPRLASVQLHEEPGADPLTGVTSIEPAGATETAGPKPECVSCHGQGSPDVKGSVKTLRAMSENPVLYQEEKNAIRIVLRALEKHHQ